MSKAKIAGVVGLLVVLVSIGVLAVVGTARAPFVTGPDRIAVVHLRGQIQESALGVFSPGAITPDLVRRRVAQAEADPRVRALVLRVDSPGGTVAASQEVTTLLREVDVPVVVSMGDLAASGGYYIATGADHIVAQAGTLTGSIGVIWSTLDVDELLDKIGVELDAVTAGEHKDMFQPGGMTPERRELVQRMVDLMYDEFVAAVADGRDLPEARVRELATGELFTGRQALELGLVDELGGTREAVAAAERLAGITDAQVVEFRPTLFEQLSAAPGAALRGLLAGGPIELQLLRDAIDGYQVPRY